MHLTKATSTNVASFYDFVGGLLLYIVPTYTLFSVQGKYVGTYSGMKKGFKGMWCKGAKWIIYRRKNL